MRRRLLLAGAAAGAASALVSGDTLAAAFDRAIGPDIDLWDERLATLGRDNMRYGSAVMRPLLEQHLTELSHTPHNGALGTHAAKLAMLYARTDPHGPSALDWYGRATRAADITNDRTTIAWTYGRAALAAGGDTTTAHKAVTYAHRSIDIKRTGDPLADIGIYMAHAALARSHANAGDRENTLSYCEQAQRAYEHIDPDADGSEYVYPDWRHALTIAYPLTLIGHRDAEHWRTQARILGATGRFDTHIRLQEAVGRWSEGDPDAPGDARRTMAAADGDQTTPILRTMAAQAGANEYARSGTAAQ